ncbi:hypothetical protein AYI69_g7307 [Smittium culicis]|uniref:Uncharacterized protein n=1 Tax=Smittium culicis TaxID=133412 RepID=A0A1R1XT43_9FUNG|nr:hypothetical protein AYI69_g7307 [Smittium culicis]
MNQKNTQKVSDLCFMDDFAVIEQENGLEDFDQDFDINQIFSEKFDALAKKIPDSDDQYILINEYKDAVSKV